MENRFTEIIQLIHQSRVQVFKTVNTVLIDLYWKVGEHISKRVEASEWGKSIVSELANFIQKSEPEIKGFSDKNLWRMKQFYEAYKDNPKLAPLVREISWTNNLIIFSRCKTMEEKEFYIRITNKENYSKRELERQISSSTFERFMLGNEKLSTLSRELESSITDTFKDTYVLEFLNLPNKHSEKDLQSAIIQQMKDFILELGKNFLFMGQEYRVQVGNSDFFIDLLFYHRGLQCLIAFELKTDKFKPEYIGQMNFYLEALDRDVKQPNENPSIGVLLCKEKDDEVVEYSLSRSLSPTMISEYKTQLPDKKILQQKLQELFINEIEGE